MCACMMEHSFTINSVIQGYCRLGLLGTHGYQAHTLYQAHDVLLIINTIC